MDDSTTTCNALRMQKALDEVKEQIEKLQDEIIRGSKVMTLDKCLEENFKKRDIEKKYWFFASFSSASSQYDAVLAEDGFDTKEQLLVSLQTSAIEWEDRLETMHIINLETEKIYSAWKKKDITKFLKFVKKDNKELRI